MPRLERSPENPQGPCEREGRLCKARPWGAVLDSADPGAHPPPAPWLARCRVALPVGGSASLLGSPCGGSSAPGWPWAWRSVRGRSGCEVLLATLGQCHTSPPPWATAASRGHQRETGRANSAGETARFLIVPFRVTTQGRPGAGPRGGRREGSCPRQGARGPAVWGLPQRREPRPGAGEDPARPGRTCASHLCLPIIPGAGGDLEAGTR